MNKIISTDSSVSKERLVQEFVHSKKMILAVEKLMANSRTKTSLVRSMEDMALVLTNQEELTPEQTALMQINANVAASVSEGDATDFYDDQLSVESYNDMSSKAVGNIASDYIIAWDKVRNALDSIIILADSGVSDIDGVITGLTEFKEEGLNDCMEEVEFKVELNILQLVQADGRDYFQALIEVRNELTDKINHSNYEFSDGISSILTDGIKKFSASTIAVALEKLVGVKTKLAGLRAYAKEEATSSEDGLVTDIALTDGYVFSNKDDCFGVVKTDLVTEHQIFKSKVDMELLDKIIFETKANKGLMLGVAAAAESLASDRLRAIIDTFSNKAESLVNSTGSDPKIRQTVLDYCKVVCEAIEAVNEDIKMMHYAARFSLAYNSFLISIVNNACPPSGDLL
jgi:ethanolamine utilization microcompartment shell protein EutS